MNLSIFRNFSNYGRFKKREKNNIILGIILLTDFYFTRRSDPLFAVRLCGERKEGFDGVDSSEKGEKYEFLIKRVSTANVLNQPLSAE